MGWRRLEQRVFTFILHISFLFKLITFVLVDFSAIARFFYLFADTLTTIKIWNALLFKQKSRPEFGGSVQRWVPMPTSFFFPSSLCCLFDLCLIQWSLNQVNYWRVKLCLHYETQVSLGIFLFSFFYWCLLTNSVLYKEKGSLEPTGKPQTSVFWNFFLKEGCTPGDAKLTLKAFCQCQAAIAGN